jgi:1-phosphofructokinase
VSNLIEGGVNRADGVAEELAGKGINVTKGLILAGIDAPGVIPIGNADPGVLERTGHAKTLIPLWIDGTLRVSTTMVIHNGATTKVNEAPRPLSEEDWASVVELTIKTVRDNSAKWLVIAGALPVYKSSGEYVDLQPIFDAMKQMGVRVALDTSGGRTLNTVGDVIDAARELCSHGVECVLASLGADGMIAVTADHAWAARTPPVKVINTVGAGDATLAGFLSAVVSNPVAEGDNHFGVGFDVPHGVSAAVQWGAVAVTQATSGLENLDHMPPAILTDNPDRSALLEEPAVA